MLFTFNNYSVNPLELSDIGVIIPGNDGTNLGQFIVDSSTINGVLPSGSILALALNGTAIGGISFSPILAALNDESFTITLPNGTPLTAIQATSALTNGVASEVFFDSTASALGVNTIQDALDVIAQQVSTVSGVRVSWRGAAIAISSDLNLYDQSPITSGIFADDQNGLIADKSLLPIGTMVLAVSNTGGAPALLKVALINSVPTWQNVPLIVDDTFIVTHDLIDHVADPSEGMAIYNYNGSDFVRLGVANWNIFQGAIDAAISAEVTARDSAISTAVGNEATSRDTAIGAAIGTEVTDRNAAISTAVSDEATARDLAIAAAITSAINTDITARDQAIADAVAAEAIARDIAITGAVGAEATARDVAIAAEAIARDIAITGAVGAEAIARDTAIGGAVSAEAIARDQAITDALTNALSTDVTARNQAIADAIALEVTNRDAAISTLEAFLEDGFSLGLKMAKGKSFTTIADLVTYKKYNETLLAVNEVVYINSIKGFVKILTNTADGVLDTDYELVTDRGVTPTDEGVFVGAKYTDSSDDNEYVYDGTRWLSVARPLLQFGAATVNGQYLTVSGAQAANVGYVMPRSGIILGITIIAGSGNAAKQYQIRKNGASIGSVTTVSGSIASALKASGYTFAATDYLQVFAVSDSGGAAKNVVATIEVGYTK